jgi:hypothetical protein
VNNIPLEAGQRTLSVVIDGSGPDKGNFDYITIDPYYPPQICDPEWWEIQDCQNSGGSLGLRAVRLPVLRLLQPMV